MITCILLGRPNVGKTLLLLNLAKFVSNGNRVKIWSVEPNGNRERYFYDIEVAKRYLCSPKPFSTRRLQWTNVNIGGRYIKLVDTTGLTNQLVDSLELRQAMSQTISFMKNASFLLHVIDISDLTVPSISCDNIDMMLCRIFANQSNYMILANKIDMLKMPTDMLYQWKRILGYEVITPVSALTKAGFKNILDYIKLNLRKDDLR